MKIQNFLIKYYDNILSNRKLFLFGLGFSYILYEKKKILSNFKNNVFRQKIIYSLKNDEKYEENNIIKPKFFEEVNKEKLMKKYPNLHILNLRSVDLIISKMRDKNISIEEFRTLSKRLVRIILEETLALDYTQETIKESPLGLYKAKKKIFEYRDYVAISILRSGNAMVDELINLFPEISVGNVMLQRDESTEEKKPKFYFEKIPKNIQEKRFLVLDPMLATGGSALKTIEIIIEKGAKEENITFVNILGCEEGIQRLTNKFPKMNIVTGKIEPFLLPNKYLAPGLGDYGDRYYGTI